MRVMQIQLLDLFTIMECHFQRAISQAIHLAVDVQIVAPFNSGESESSCTYYYSFLFSGWWFNNCGSVFLNGKYNPSFDDDGFRWYSQTTGSILPNRSEMKIRRQ